MLNDGWLFYRMNIAAMFSYIHSIKKPCLCRALRFSSATLALQQRQNLLRNLVGFSQHGVTGLLDDLRFRHI